MLGDHQRPGVVEHLVAGIKGSIRSQRQRDGVGGPAVQADTAPRPPNRQLSDEHSFLDLGHLHMFDPHVEALDEGDEQVVSQGPRRWLPAQCQGDGERLAPADEDRQNPLRGVLLA